MRLNIVPHQTEINVGSISHVRHIVKRLELPEEFGAETRIQVGGKHYYCKERPTVVADLIDEARHTDGRHALAKLTLPGGQPVWFAGELAEGPVRLSSGEIGDGIHSAFLIGNLLTRVRDMPEEVAEVIKAAKGKAKKPAQFVGLSRQITPKTTKAA